MISRADRATLEELMSKIEGEKPLKAPSWLVPSTVRRWSDEAHAFIPAEWGSAGFAEDYAYGQGRGEGRSDAARLLRARADELDPR